jgi:hypothetical protein
VLLNILVTTLIIMLQGHLWRHAPLIWLLHASNHTILRYYDGVLCPCQQPTSHVVLSPLQ